MTGSGYGAARSTTEAVARSLEGMATLIGEAGGEPMVLPDGSSVTPGLGLREDAASLLARARDLRQGLFTIIVVGEFKNGKSTLLNAMLGTKTLPAKAAPATAIITALVYGHREDVAIYESGRAEPRSVSWEEFVREFQLTPQDQETIQEHGSVDRFARVEYAEMERDHALCAHGVKLIDSPGLGEHVSRTRVATNFLKRSQAIIVVLNATRILTRDERVFIESMLGEGRLDHVFFVVNRIDQVDPGSRAEIEEWVRSQLESHFTRGDGTFDVDLYRRRVSFLNARGALEARGTIPHDEESLAASGVPALEQELEHFLTTEARVAAILQSTTQALQPVMAGALERITQARSALDAPVEELEVRREVAERHLHALEDRKRETERTVLRFGDVVKQKVFADLRAFVDTLPETWDEDSHRLMDLDSALSLRNVLMAYAQPETRQRIAAAISEEVQRYVQVSFTAWSEKIPGAIESTVAALLAEVEAQIGDLQLELDRIAAAFAGTPRRDRARSETGAPFQLALSLSEVAGITDDVLSLGDLNSVLGRLVQQSIIGYLISTFMRTSLLMSTILVEVIQAGLSESEIKRRVRQKLGERLFEALRDQVNDRQAFVHGAVEERFQQFAERIAGMIGTQIDEARAEQERILQQKRDEQFSVAAEKLRLDAIAAELRRLNAGLMEAARSPLATTA